MKKTTLLLALFLFFAAFSANAQVKQIFKVVSYPDGKPLAGAVATLYGQPLQTNAKGVAVANLPENRKGDFLCLSVWSLDGYYQIGRTKDSRYRFFQSKDTVCFYLAKEADYREAVSEMFVRYFRPAYDSEVEVMLALRDSAQRHPDMADDYAQSLMDIATHAYSPVISKYYRDAISTSPYRLYRLRDDVRAVAEPFIQKGELDSATQAVKAMIRKDDVSRNNLEIINNYLYFRDLNLVKNDDEPASTYTRILYKNHFSDLSVGEHLLNLLNENNWEEADSITAKEADRIPEYSFLFEPSIAKYANGEDPERLAEAFQRYVDKSEKVCRNYPYSDSYWALYVSRCMLVAALQMVGDTVRINQQWDSLLVACQQYIDTEFGGDFYKNRVAINVYSDILERVSRGASAYSDAKLLELEAAVYRAAKENYTRYPSDLFLQLQYAGRTNIYANSIEQAAAENPLRLELYRKQAEINEILIKSFPEMFTVNYMVAQSSLLAYAVYVQEEDDDMVRDAVRGFKRSFVMLDSLYPHVFTSVALDFCSGASDYLHNQKRNGAVAELDAFIELLLDTHAKENSRSIEAEKAQFFNHKAEKMYYYEQYESTLDYYEEANRYYQMAVEKDPELWIPFLTNYLQMGDAYLNMGMNEKALATYRQIFTYESQIPASQMASYTRLKGETHYYSGDAYRLISNTKVAEKEYKAAESLYKKAMALGDSSACFSLGEMYHTKAIAQYNEGNFKKVVPLMEKSAQYYQLYPMSRTYQRYEQVLSVLENYYKVKDSIKYVRNLESEVEYYKRFSDRDTSYLNNYLSYSEKFVPLNLEPQRQLKYAKYEVEAHRKTIDWGKEMSVSFLQSLYRLAKAYTAADSNKQALKVYDECLKVNRSLLMDTSATQCAANAIVVYGEMVDCASTIGDAVDEPEDKDWYEKALSLCDTMIRLTEEYIDESNDYQVYQLSKLYFKNAVICSQLDWHNVAIGQLDKANEYLLKLYEGKYKDVVEAEVIQNIYLKGLLAAESNDPDMAKSYYSEAVEYATRADDINSVAVIYYQTVEAWLDILEHRDVERDEATIASLQKQRDALIKILKGKK
ncbi:MAG: hypothetical protein IJP72_08135 [Bacteroidales bacterium]|nr:hypothetical protein [Bacteroidales bacterium]